MKERIREDMVLNDIVRDYDKLTELLEDYVAENSYIDAVLRMIGAYENTLSSCAESYVKSNQNQNEMNTLINRLHALPGAYRRELSDMQCDTRRTTKLIVALEQMEFASETVQSFAKEIVESLNRLMDMSDQYASNSILGGGNEQTFFRLIEAERQFGTLWTVIHRNRKFLTDIEQEVTETYVSTDETREISRLEIRSYTETKDVRTFATRIELLDNVFEAYGRLNDVNTADDIYHLEKIESGTFRSLFSSDCVNFSVFPDLIHSLAEAIRALRVYPYENTQEKTISKEQHGATKMQIVVGQVPFFQERMELADTDKEKAELLEKFILYLLDYIEQNPKGEINGVKYDIQREILKIQKIQEPNREYDQDSLDER